MAARLPVRASPTPRSAESRQSTAQDTCIAPEVADYEHGLQATGRDR
jgi:hypothetical protein